MGPLRVTASADSRFGQMTWVESEQALQPVFFSLRPALWSRCHSSPERAVPQGRIDKQPENHAGNGCIGPERSTGEPCCRICSWRIDEEPMVAADAEHRGLDEVIAQVHANRHP
jgi:hypothetical protein